MSRPRMRSAHSQPALSRSRARPAGRGRPGRGPAYRGLRQARTSTQNDTMSAAVPPAIASDAGTGRSLAPPSPCSGATGPTMRLIMRSADLELHDQLAEVLDLRLDHAGLVDADLHL